MINKSHIVMEIQPIGKYLPQDENGFIINDLSIDKIDKKWRPILEIITKTYQQKLGKNLISVYLRGSVARNLAVDGISDLDTFALVKPSFSKKTIRWQTADFQEETTLFVKLNYSFCSNLEMNLATYDTNFPTTNLAMIIQTQSILLFGQPLEKELSRYKVEALLLNNKWLESDILDFLQIPKNQFNLEECQKIMKVIIRCGFELVMCKIGRFSPDLYICYRDFSIFYPQKKSEMQQALIWYLNPISDKLLLNKFINNFGNWLLHELKTKNMSKILSAENQYFTNLTSK